MIRHLAAIFLVIGLGGSAPAMAKDNAPVPMPVPPNGPKPEPTPPPLPPGDKPGTTYMKINPQRTVPRPVVEGPGKAPPTKSSEPPRESNEIKGLEPPPQPEPDPGPRQ